MERCDILQKTFTQTYSDRRRMFYQFRKLIVFISLSLSFMLSSLGYATSLDQPAVTKNDKIWLDNQSIVSADIGQKVHVHLMIVNWFRDLNTAAVNGVFTKTGVRNTSDEEVFIFASDHSQADVFWQDLLKERENPQDYWITLEFSKKKSASAEMRCTLRIGQGEIYTYPYYNAAYVLGYE